MDNNQTSKKSSSRRFTKVKGCPGIFRIELWDKGKQKYVDPRYTADPHRNMYRAFRWIQGHGKKVQQIKHFRTVEEAKAWRNEQKPLPPEKKATFSIRELVQEWRAWSKPPRFAPSTWQNYGKDVSYLHHLLDIPVEGLTAEDIDQWLKFLIDPKYPKKCSRVSYLRELKTLSTVLGWYREYRNPKFQSPILRRHRKDCFFKAKPGRPDLSLSVEDIERFLEELKQCHNPVYAYVASFQALSGARIGEACGLKWECVDLAEFTVHIRRTCYWDVYSKIPSLREDTKTGEQRTIVMPPRLVMLLSEWKRMNEGHELVFHKDGQLLKYNAIQSAYKHAFRKLGLPVRSTHVLRHTFATIFSEQTDDIRGTQAAMGHRDLRITQHYAKVAERTQRKVMHKFTLGQIKTEDKTPDPQDGCGGKVIPLFQGNKE